MIIYINSNHNPCFNLAAEEFLVKSANEPVFMLWRNEKAVIIGVNQNTAAEVSREFCEENGIKIVRRLTGGGAVFHDLGNVNYTYIEKNDGEKFSNYAFFTRDIIDYLATFGITAKLSGRNDVLIDGKKIIGNAQCVKNGNIMHHGCILYSSDLSTLSGALKVNKAKIESKGIKSVSSRVTNICDHISNPPSVENFINGLQSFVKKRHGCTVKEFSSEEIREIEKLSREKYSAFEWNFGESPDYSYQKTEKFLFGLLSISLNAKDGIIENLKIFGDFFGTNDIIELEKAFIGVRHEKKSLMTALEKVNVDLFIKGCTATDLIKLFF